MTISDGMAGPKDGWEGIIVMRLDGQQGGGGGVTAFGASDSPCASCN